MMQALRSTALDSLIAALDAAMSAAPDTFAAAVTGALRACWDDERLVPAALRRAHADCYARHMLHADAAGRYAVLAIAWGPGQQSPIHGHHCWCSVAVYEGELTETYYRAGVDGETPLAVRSIRRRPGDLSFDLPHGGIHRIANTGSGTAVSLHVYGVSQERISTGVNRVVG